MSTLDTTVLGPCGSRPATWKVSGLENALAPFSTSTPNRLLDPAGATIFSSPATVTCGSPSPRGATARAAACAPAAKQPFGWTERLPAGVAVVPVPAAAPVAAP